MIMNKSSTLSLLLAAAGACLVGPSASGAILATYMHDGSNNATPSTVDSSLVTASEISAPAGNTYWLESGRVQDASGYATFEEARDDENNIEYIDFTLTPVADPIDLDELVMDVRPAAQSNIRGFFLRSSQDGFNEVLYSSGDLNATTHVAIDLSNLVPVTSSEPITFRIYSHTGNASGKIGYYNIELTGDVVPEPASLALAGIASLALLPVRRRSR